MQIMRVSLETIGRRLLCVLFILNRSVSANSVRKPLLWISGSQPQHPREMLSVRIGSSPKVRKVWFLGIAATCALRSVGQSGLISDRGWTAVSDPKKLSVLTAAAQSCHSEPYCNAAVAAHFLDIRCESKIGEHTDSQIAYIATFWYPMHEPQVIVLHSCC